MIRRWLVIIGMRFLNRAFRRLKRRHPHIDMDFELDHPNKRIIINVYTPNDEITKDINRRIAHKYFGYGTVTRINYNGRP